MTMATEEPVVSGQAYTVAQVDGRPPTGLGKLHRGTGAHPGYEGCIPSGVRRGNGTLRQGPVPSERPRPGPDGKDVRVWTISDPGGGSPLLAEHCTAAEPPANFPASQQTRPLRSVPDPPAAAHETQR